MVYPNDQGKNTSYSNYHVRIFLEIHHLERHNPEGLYQRIENIGYKMIIDDEAKRFVASKGYDIQFGARPLRIWLSKLS